MSPHRNRVLAAALVTLLALPSLAFRGCGGGEKNKTPEEIAAARVATAATGVTVAARSIEAGIDSVRAFREAGKIKPETSLRLARSARDANKIAERVARYLLARADLGEEDRRTLLDDVGEFLDLARSLESFRVSDNSDVRLVFDLGVTAGKSALVIAADELRASLPAGLRVRLTPEARSKLEAALPVIERNEARLAAVIKLLDAPAG